jgi:hypothetical protein
MNIHFRTLGILVATAWFLAARADVNAESLGSAPEQAIAHATKQNKPIFIMFYKEKNPASDAMLGVVKANKVVKAEQAIWTTVRLSDPAERPVAEKFKVTRAPMPAVVAVYPNGAVTGVFPTRVTQTDLTGCIVSPKAAECLKHLQDNRLVLICVQTAPEQTLPQGVRDFKADPHFAKRTTILTVSVDDPNEAKFLTGMDLDLASIDSPVTVFLAPPGAHVGTFAETASKEEIADGLAEAGKCCNDKNCKHNQKSK